MLRCPRKQGRRVSKGLQNLQATNPSRKKPLSFERGLMGRPADTAMSAEAVGSCFCLGLFFLTVLAQRGDLRCHHGQLGLRHGNVDVVLGVLQRFFGSGFGFGGFGFVEVLAANSRVAEHRHAVRLHFQQATGDENKLFGTVGFLNAYRARLDERDQRRVAWVNAQLARLARQGDEFGLARKDGLFGADNIDTNGVRGVHGLDLLGFFEGFVDSPYHVERLFRQMITLAGNDHLEAANGFGEADVLAG